MLRATATPWRDRVTPEEAKAHVKAQDEKLARLEEEIRRLATSHSNVLFIAILGELVDTVCGVEAPHFRVMRKIQFYQRVIAKLEAAGIR